MTDTGVICQIIFRHHGSSFSQAGYLLWPGFASLRLRQIFLPIPSRIQGIVFLIPYFPVLIRILKDKEPPTRQTKASLIYQDAGKGQDQTIIGCATPANCHHLPGAAGHDTLRGPSPLRSRKITSKNFSRFKITLRRYLQTRSVRQERITDGDWQGTMPCFVPSGAQDRSTT